MQNWEILTRKQEIKMEKNLLDTSIQGHFSCIDAGQTQAPRHTTFFTKVKSGSQGKGLPQCDKK
jgi:hypothetical protein